MSPSSRGLVPGLFLALAAALGVLAANAHWLLPAQGETGVRYFVASPVLARGETPLTPWIPSAEATPEDALAGRGRLMPAIMAGLIRRGAKPYVSALWVLAGSAAVAVLALAWTAGGAAGLGGALAAGLVLLAAPPTLESITVLGPDVVLAALAALLLGTLTYRPRAGALHGAVAALAWSAHPAGLGLVAVSMVWPFIGAAGHRNAIHRLGGMGTAALPSALLLGAGAWHPLLLLPHLHGGDPGAAAMATLEGVLSFLAAGLPGILGVAVGTWVLGLLAALVTLEARSTPHAPPDLHWSDPAAPDALAEVFRPAAALVALGAVLGAWAAWTGELLSAPWYAATIPLAALGAASAVRWKRKRTGLRAWLPLTCLVVWILGSTVNTWRGLSLLREEGKGYTSAHWVESPLIRWIDNESAPYPVLYADQPALILLQTGRPSREIRLLNGDLDAFLSLFRTAPGAVILTGEDLPQAAMLMQRLGLRVVVDEPLGRVLAP